MNVNKFKILATKHIFKGGKCGTFKGWYSVLYWWWMQRNWTWK